MALTLFGLVPVRTPEFLTGGVDNYNSKVSTNAGDVVVRFYNIRSADVACDELALAEWLGRNGYPTPIPLRRPTGGHVAIVSRR
ncbi:MAG TPA: phosphotransferase, partial [Thermoanaerobaculia bacterium]|nr:phosphotransferase [Thermoanaerobaculia bacterium]